jgi:hypothetical protein
MRLSYKKLGFALAFDEKVNFVMPPAFVLRSVIGSQLHHLCCVAPNTPCAECMFSQSCAYGFAFESIVPKDNQVLNGRDRISHPVIIETEQFDGITTDSLVCYLIFLGAAVKYLPYFYYALKNGGKSGLLKERHRFAITDVRDGSRSLLLKEDALDTRFETDLWEYAPAHSEPGEPRETEGIRKHLMLQLMSPLRFKTGGRYTGSFTAGDFALSLHRRAQTLCSQYGFNDFSAAGTEAASGYRFSRGWDIAEKGLAWRDYTHYSARQRQPMLLGGLAGYMKLSGVFTPYEYALLRFAEIFHAGKNANFGLGKIDIWEKN